MVDDFDEVHARFVTQGFASLPFQEEVWRAFAAGESGLVHTPRGMGKTHAAALGPIALASCGTPSERPPLTLLWLKGW
jgi:ATP-dependent helicase Lhr and Lhr-like helicase